MARLVPALLVVLVACTGEKERPAAESPRAPTVTAEPTTPAATTPVVEEETIPAEEETLLEPSADQLALGSGNPCYGGKFPDDIASLKAQGIPEKDLLVDPKTNDIYDSVCIGARINSYGETWPPGVGERLVLATDL